ncbi:MAG TPA: methyltransferase domain-containing protein [Candidatus Baltobacteraceae bacterium]|nr:methyltransferase domain-containing protein [Candidatus Baltobacteraceae bacterium]
MRRAIARELMDEPVDDVAELAANLRDVAFANARFGGATPVLRAIRRIGARTVLDVGSGLADVPRALLRDAAARGVALRVTCLDRSEQMLRLARAAAPHDSALQFVHADGERLPFEAGTFDAVTCTLALHHFDPSAARLLLRELRRVARIAPVVCDLRRSALGYAATWLWSRTSRNRLTRHDAPLSVRRAYTPTEALQLAREAGWLSPRVRREPFFRMTLVDGGLA